MIKSWNTFGAGVAFALAITCAATGAQATNLLVNGGFETGDSTGWDTHYGSMVVGNGFNSEFAQSGNYFAAVGDPHGGYIGQFFQDNQGHQYQLSFYIMSDGGINWAGGNGFTVCTAYYCFPGIGNIPDQRPSGYKHYVWDFTGAGYDYVYFGVFDGTGYFALDNVSVTSIPEPATWGMILTGLCGLGAVQRSRRRLVSTL